MSKENGITLIAEERERQVNEEGYSADHDDSHDCCELAKAGAYYALPSNWRAIIDKEVIHSLWPWPPYEFVSSPDDRVRELVKAGALIAAEIDRLLRRSESLNPKSEIGNPQ